MYRLLFSRESKTIATGYVSCYFYADKKMTHPQLLEKRASTPLDLNPKGFNTSAQLPYGLTPQHIKRAMQDLLDFLGFINGQLFSKSIPRHPTPYRHAPPTAGDAPGLAVSPCDLLQNLLVQGLATALLKRVFSLGLTLP